MRFVLIICVFFNTINIKISLQIIYQQQQRIVITTFNLLSLYYSAELYTSQRSLNIDELACGVVKLKRIFEQLGAHVATNENCIKPEIIETVEIHSNIVHFRVARLHCTQLSPGQLAQEIDNKRLKAHALLPQTMAIAVPTLALQLYINPCCFWLARPAFLIIAALDLSKDKEHQSHFTCNADLEKKLFQRVAIIEDIFKHEFVIESNRVQEV